jgi:hypothetical protein
LRGLDLVTPALPLPAGGSPDGSLDLAPIALFVYRRTDLLDQVLDALEACPEFEASRLFVFSDGPKDGASEADVHAVRCLLQRRFRPNMQVVEAGSNQGLARSIIDGVSQLTERYGQVIVLEDDLIVTPSTLTWFNAALQRYASEERVMQVSGYMFDSPVLRRLERAVLLPMTTSWGWATWKRAWDGFDPLASGWQALSVQPDLRKQFDLGNRYPYSRMLERQMRGEIDSWAVRWYWSVFQANGLCLFPPKTHVSNLGQDRAATHPGALSRLRWIAARSRPPLQSDVSPFPSTMAADLAVLRQVGAAIDHSPLSRLMRRLSH